MWKRKSGFVLLPLGPDNMTRTFFAVQFAILSLLVAAGAAAQPSELPDDVRRCYPLTVRQAADWSTLEEQILADEVVGSQTHPGRKARWIKVRYFSHEWIDGPWHATTRIVMPASHKEIRPGLAVICPAGVATRGREPGFTVEQDFMERTAMEFGVPVASMPNQ